jgi:hypothetical protein
MDNRLDRRIKKIEKKIGVGKHQGATYIEIRPSLEDSEEEEETSHRIRLGGGLWATAVGSAFSLEQIASLKAEYARLTPEQLAAKGQVPVTFIHVWPNGNQLRTNVDFNRC